MSVSPFSLATRGSKLLSENLHDSLSKSLTCTIIITTISYEDLFSHFMSFSLLLFTHFLAFYPRARGMPFFLLMQVNSAVYFDWLLSVLFYLVKKKKKSSILTIIIIRTFLKNIFFFKISN